MYKLSRIASGGILVISLKKIIPSRIEFLNIIITKSDRELVSVFKNGIMSTSNLKVVVDHESDLSSAKEPTLFLSFLFLQTDPFLELAWVLNLFCVRYVMWCLGGYVLFWWRSMIWSQRVRWDDWSSARNNYVTSAEDCETSM